MRMALVVLAALLAVPVAAADILAVNIEQAHDYAGGAAFADKDEGLGASSTRLIDRPLEGGFRVVEESAGFARTEVVFDVAVPAGAEWLQASFQAIRRITAEGPVASDPVVHQRFAFRTGPDDTAQVADLFNPRTRSGNEAFAFTLDLASGTETVRLEWSLLEESPVQGERSPHVNVGNLVTVDVADIVWSFGYAYQGQSTESHMQAVPGPGRVVTSRLDLELPPGAGDRTHVALLGLDDMDGVAVRAGQVTLQLARADSQGQWVGTLYPGVQGGLLIATERYVPVEPGAAGLSALVLFFVLPLPAGLVATVAALRTANWARLPGNTRHTLLSALTFACWIPYVAAIVLGVVMPGAVWGMPVLGVGIAIYSLLILALLGFVMLVAMHRRWQSHVTDVLLSQERRQREQLEKANDDLTQFAYIASHDLREPLRTVSRFTEIIERDYAPKLDPKGREFVRFAAEGAQRMETLLTDLLEYTRTGTSLNIQTVDLAHCVRSAKWGLRVARQEAEATIRIGPLPSVEGDPHLLIQVFQNIFSNALKFRDPAVRPVVSVTSKTVAGGVQVSIRDNGIGIPTAAIERIFQPFSRGHGRGQFAGTGIGLAVAKKIVDKHHGSIIVHSAVGQGTEFVIWLPNRQPVSVLQTPTVMSRATESGL